MSYTCSSCDIQVRLWHDDNANQFILLRDVPCFGACGIRRPRTFFAHKVSLSSGLLLHPQSRLWVSFMKFVEGLLTLVQGNSRLHWGCSLAKFGCYTSFICDWSCHEKSRKRRCNPQSSRGATKIRRYKWPLDHLECKATSYKVSNLSRSYVIYAAKLRIIVHAILD